MLDIGIDLGTSTILAGNAAKGVLIREPAVVAVDRKTGRVISIGEEVYKMIGRTPDNIQVIRPLSSGVISNYRLTGVLIKYVLKKICNNSLIKPRVIVCVPSAITGIESQSVVESTVAAGARQVYLIEEPVAAALGAGLDITKPMGNMIVDIGGGTTDIAVLSLKGIVCKSSIKTASMTFDEVIVKYMRSKYSLLIGEKTAEEVKKCIGSVWDGDSNSQMVVKGRDIASGLPAKLPVNRHELVPYMKEIASEILLATQNVLEKTPPELVGDIRTNGITLTGGGALLSGLDKFISTGTNAKTRVAENPADCVAIGTSISFDYLGKLFDGFLDISSHVH